MTARTALLMVLGEIGGTESVECCLSVALSTNDPLELALAAKIIEELEPNRHRAAVVAAARNLLESGPANGAALIAYLAHYGSEADVYGLERIALSSPADSEAAVAGLVTMRASGGDHALVRLWRNPGLSETTRIHVSKGLGAAVSDSMAARDELIRMFRDTRIPDATKSLAIQGVARGEELAKQSLLPSGAIVWARPHSDWITARLEILDTVDTPSLSPTLAAKVQNARDTLLAELERTQ